MDKKKGKRGTENGKGKDLRGVFGLLKRADIDTTGMTGTEAIDKLEELQEDGYVAGVGTTKEIKKMKERGTPVGNEQKDSNLTNEEQALQELTGEKVEHEPTDEEKKKKEEEEKKKKELEAFYKELKNKVQKLKSVPHKVKDREVLIEFDENSAGKNINSEKFNSTAAGWKWKQRNVHKWREMLANARYTGSAPEKCNKLDKNGNVKAAHDGVKEWHYFKGAIRDETGKRYLYKFHIRDKEGKLYVYELEMHLIKNKKRNKKEPTQ